MLARFFNAAPRRFASDRRGVAVVEFAIIAPLLIMIYLMMVEASQAIDTNKKLDRSAYMVADLITQQSSISRQDIDAVLTLGRNLLRPYDRSVAQISVAMYKKDGGSGKMEWWNATDISHKPVAVDPSPPTSLADGDLYLKAAVDLRYKPILTYNNSQDSLNLTNFNISMGSTRVLVPRMDNTECADCTKN
ncbi:TadE/TadG family type IV pilus assembly protein [Limoniibacter endophyticus]|uniref:TadE-like domain-containing protein n=1 Tax=Limoniibacter endophyticus TaxID=1565040 RepID=A0A8J3DNS2_9HYPH|nr:TadE/TadG family type IV pilus assembly protein [Limoniibacter endophyticus]GHC67115.1 hypothetical protein GCM10010136_10870 [Limoniibacter endophyticus]